MRTRVFVSSIVVFLFIGSACLPLIMEPTSPDVLAADPPSKLVNSLSSSTFAYGKVEESKQVGDSVEVYIPLEAGYSMTSGSVNVSLEGTEVSSTETYSVSNGGLNGTMNGTVSDGTSIALQTASFGPSQSGNNSSSLLNSVSWSGVHAYDTLELTCGSVSCGSIVATGDLILYVNTLIVGQGTSIQADDLATGGSGVGASTLTSSNGRNDGGGGAGHGGSGGSGGGANGGSGGSTYGNGTESGSQGGGVSSSYHSAVYGGQGGGYIQIYADTILVNGSIEADGGDGDAGSQSSGGTGPGGSGGGGGSGGSIFIQTNTLNVGTYGRISTDGGDGGAGADGAQNGVGFGMYDGGDGGGGGAGGRILVSTQSGGYTNSGTVQSSSGSGGAKGLKYGTGIDGIDGTSGSSGAVTTSTWAGYISTVNVTLNNGSFISQAIETQIEQASFAYLTHTVSVPANSSLTAHYRWTIEGNDTSWEHWSEWSELPLNGTWIPRHHWIQVKYDFNRSLSASPVLTAIALQTSAWTTLENTAFHYDGIPTAMEYHNTTIGFTDSVINTSSSQLHSFTFAVPFNATLLDDVSVWMGWTSIGPPDYPPAHFYEAKIGSTVVNSSLLDWKEEGHDIGFDSQVLQYLIQSASPWEDGEGMQWVTLNVSVSMQGTTSMTFGHLWMPWSFSSTVEISSQVNTMILSECFSFYESTDGVCLGPLQHPFTLSASPPSAGTPAFSYTINAPSFEWEDTYAPEINFIQHRKSGEPTPDVRVGDSYSLVLFDVMKELDLTVQLLGHDWQESDGFGTATVFSYASALQGYYLMMSTDDMNADSTQQLNLTFRVLDHNLNEVSPRPTYILTINPSAPDVASLSIVGTSPLTGGIGNLWDIDGAMFEFTVTDTNQRMSLDVNLHLTHQFVGTVELTMNWSESESAYVVLWQPNRDHLGLWGVEVDMRENNGLAEVDSDGLNDGQDAALFLVDSQGPVLSVVDFNDEVERGSPQFVNMSWSGQEGESTSGSISIVQGSIVLDFKNILPTLLNSSSLMFETDEFEPGHYTIVIQLEDDVGNQAVHSGNGTYSFAVLPAWVDGNITVNAYNETSLQIIGNVTWRTGSGQITLVDTNGSISEQFSASNGVFEAFVSLENSLEPLMTFTIEACDVNQSEGCFTRDIVLNFTSSFDLNVDSICSVTNLNVRTSDGSEAVSCEVFNDGFVPTTLKFLHPLNASLISESLFLVPGESGRLSISLANGSLEINRSIEWFLTVENDVYGPETSDMGQVQINRSLPSKDIDSTTDELSGDTSGSVSFLVTVVGLLVIVAIAGALFYRTSQSVGRGEFDDDVAEDYLSESIEPISSESIEVMMHHDDQEPSPLRSGPSADQEPTSVDGSGYEWYSYGELHWYRYEGSDGEWFPFEQ